MFDAELTSEAVEPLYPPVEEGSYTGTATVDEIAELVDLYLEDNDAYCKRFYPQTCRHLTAPFQHRIDDALWSRRRKIAIKVFRGGAKTTRVRIFLSKRIAYGISRTILYISKSEDTAEATLEWLKHQVEKQTDWALFYGIQKGSVWSADKAEFFNSVLGVTITVIAVGIHGQIRGLNFDDHRPDLIVCDDIEDEKTTNTTDQIKKHSALLHGTVLRSLASPTDNPEAKIVIIQTPLNPEDAIEKAFVGAGDDVLSDWYCVEASCLEELDFNVLGDDKDNLISAWPAMFPTQFLLNEKATAIKENELSIWMREMEVKVISPETCSFDFNNLVVHDYLPDYLWEELVLWVDPASSDRKTADYHATSVTAKFGAHAFLCFYALNRGMDIDASIKSFFDAWDLMIALGRRSRANLRFGVEGRTYQVQLKRALEKAMIEKKRLAYIEDVKDPRKSKEDVINQAFKPVTANKCYHVLREHTEFISDFTKYPQVKHDDLMETAARGLDMLDLTGTAGEIALGTVEREMATPALISRSANRIIKSTGLSLGRFRTH